MRELTKRPEVQAKLIAFRASDRCPINQPENSKKQIERQRALGFPNLNYDGAPTVPQKILFDALRGATMEFKIPKIGKMKIDIAIPSLKLAIEVDGLSHTKRGQKEKDAKKEQALKARGWTLLRFWNAEILGDLSSVLARIQAQITVLEKAG
jgi:very-short-patch-repair endonuclease